MSLHALFTSSSLGAIALFAALTSSRAHAEDQVFFRVMGSSSNDPNHVQAWSPPFDSEGEAQAELQKIKSDYAPGGLLESSPHKPVGLHVAKFTSSGRQSVARSIPPADLSPPSSGGLGGTIKQPSPGNQPTTMWEMWLEERQQKDWVEVPERRYRYADYSEFLSAYKAYMTTLESLNRGGRRYQLNWKELSPGQRRQESSRPAPLQVSGKRGIGTLGAVDGGTKFTVTFRDNGVAEMMTAEEGKVFLGSWTQRGAVISMKAGASEFSGEIRGNSITGERSRRRGTYVATEDAWRLTIK